MAQPLGSSIETQIVDGPNLVSQVQENQNILQTVVQDVPQIQTVLTDNVNNVSSVINAPFVEVTSVNGMTGDVITEPIMQNYQNNHYYPQNTIVNYNGVIYWAKNTFTSGNSFDSTKWNTVSVQAYKNLGGQLQLNSYRRSVVALCRVSTTNNTSFESYTSGRFMFKRDNGLSGIAEINVNVENQYSKAYYFNASYYSNLKCLPATGVNLNTDEGFRFCTFKYNDVYYGGIEFFVGNAQFMRITFEGVGNFTPFGLDYYKTSGSGTAEVLNQEVYDSLNYTQFDWNKAVIGARSLSTDTGYIYKNNTYIATLPDKNGTIAMTSDIPAAQIQSDWNQTTTTAKDYIKNKPTIPTVNNATLTIQKNGTTVNTFTANASSNKTANITVPEITAQTTDPGEGSTLTTGNLICVYDA